MDAPTLSFFNTLLTFPAILPSILLGVILLYWFFVILGALDIDVIDFDFGKEGGDFLYVAGISGIPSTITISLLIFNLWILCVPATYYLALLLPAGILQIVVGFGILLIALIIAAQLTVWLVKPWRSFFIEPVHSNASLIGKVCIISTATVDEEFGQANYEDGGAGLILNVRSNTPNFLQRNSRALIIDYDKATHSYTVTELEEI